MNMHMQEKPRIARKPRSAAMIEFYTQCRIWHGYLSAFAFLMLMFFAATGVLLNHPDWLAEPRDPETVTATIAADQLTAAGDSGAALASLATEALPVIGAYSSADVDSREALLRFEGVKGLTTVIVDRRTGQASADIQKADTLTMLDDLHRGKNVGAVWASVIDVSGVLILVLSLVGYVLFFAMRFRLRTALILTGVSLASLAGIFVLFVP